MMNINTGHIDAGSGDYAIRHNNSARNVSNHGKRDTERPSTEGLPMNDAAHTSLLARVASRELQRLHAEDTIRADKVAQFKHLGADDATFSDSEIDAIMTRMLG